VKSQTTTLTPIGEPSVPARDYDEQDAGEGMEADRPAASGPGDSDVALTEKVERGFTFAILLSALRCTVQYVILPFVLPWIGVAAAVPAWLTLALSTLALFSLVRNVRYLWRLRHARRWSYVVLTVLVMAALLLFFVLDLRAILR